MPVKPGAPTPLQHPPDRRRPPAHAIAAEAARKAPKCPACLLAQPPRSWLRSLLSPLSIRTRESPWDLPNGFFLSRWHTRALARVFDRCGKWLEKGMVIPVGFADATYSKG